MKYEEILKDLGSAGRWQALICGLCWIPAIFVGSATLANNFSGLKPKQFRCRIPECDPLDPEVFDFPDIFSVNDNNRTNFCRMRPFLNKTSGDECVFDRNSFVECHPEISGMIYSRPFVMNSTFTTEFDLVCGQDFKVALASSIFMAGVLIGSLFYGFLTDFLGRKKAGMLAFFSCALFQIMASFMPNYETFAAMKFLSATGSMGMYLAHFLLMVEVVGNDWTTFVGATKGIPFAIGELILALICYLVH